MSSKKYFYTMCATLALLFLLIGGAVFGGNYILQKQSQKLTDLKVENKSLEAQQTAVARAKKDIDQYSELDSIAKSIVPQDKDQAKTVREIVQIAQQSGIPINSITFPNSTLGTAAPAAGTSPTTATPSTKTPISQLKPVDGIKGVSTLEIQVTSTTPVNYNNLLKFLEALEKNRRTAHVSTISLNPSPKNRSMVNFSVAVNAYVKQ